MSCEVSVGSLRIGAEFFWRNEQYCVIRRNFVTTTALPRRAAAHALVNFFNASQVHPKLRCGSVYRTIDAGVFYPTIEDGNLLVDERNGWVYTSHAWGTNIIEEVPIGPGDLEGYRLLASTDITRAGDEVFDQAIGEWVGPFVGYAVQKRVIRRLQPSSLSPVSDQPRGCVACTCR